VCAEGEGRLNKVVADGESVAEGTIGVAKSRDADDVSWIVADIGTGEEFVYCCVRDSKLKVESVTRAVDAEGDDRAVDLRASATDGVGLRCHVDVRLSK
jgi:hypothetical protein